MVWSENHQPINTGEWSRRDVRGDLWACSAAVNRAHGMLWKSATDRARSLSLSLSLVTVRSLWLFCSALVLECFFFVMSHSLIVTMDSSVVPYMATGNSEITMLVNFFNILIIVYPNTVRLFYGKINKYEKGSREPLSSCQCVEMCASKKIQWRQQLKK